jgi:hypothetical protein
MSIMLVAGTRKTGIVPPEPYGSPTLGSHLCPPRSRPLCILCAQLRQLSFRSVRIGLHSAFCRDTADESASVKAVLDVRRSTTGGCGVNLETGTLFWVGVVARIMYGLTTRRLL